MYELDIPILKFDFSNKFMVSTNDMYFYVPYMKGNRKTTHAVKTQALKDLQKICEEKLSELIPDSFINLCREYLDKRFYGLRIISYYYMPKSNYESSDVSNYVKAYEDCISTRLKGPCKKNKSLDDKNNLEYHAIKYCGKDDLWHIHTEISIVPRDKYYRSLILNIDESKLTNIIGFLSTIEHRCPICNSIVNIEFDESIGSINEHPSCIVCGSKFNYRE